MQPDDEERRILGMPGVNRAASPGGMDPVAAIAASSTADLSFVMALQTPRLAIVLLANPPLAPFIAQRTGQGSDPAGLAPCPRYVHSLIRTWSAWSRQNSLSRTQTSPVRSTCRPTVTTGRTRIGIGAGKSGCLLPIRCSQSTL